MQAYDADVGHVLMQLGYFSQENKHAYFLLQNISSYLSVMQNTVVTNFHSCRTT